MWAWRSHCLFCLWPSVGYAKTTAWAFDVTEVIVDYSLLSAPMFVWASHGTQREERRLPFISTLIFLCDGWLSYCVICAFEKCSFEQKKLPASKSYNQAQLSECGCVLATRPSKEVCTSATQKKCHWCVAFKFMTLYSCYEFKKQNKFVLQIWKQKTKVLSDSIAIHQIILRMRKKKVLCKQFSQIYFWKNFFQIA